MGTALLEIRESRLYRESHATGIDPERGGALASYESVVIDTPPAVVANGKTSRHAHLPGEMARIIHKYSGGGRHVYLEAVHSMPGQDV